MKYVLVALVYMGWLAMRPRVAEAHQPRVITGGEIVDVRKPEVSQAFYATLDGRPAEYRIRATEPFQLYISLLVPDMPGRRNDFTVEVLGHGDAAIALANLDGSQSPWRPFFEPFAGDRYYQGPEFARQMPAGEYLVRVTNPEGVGRYVLAVGRKESFTFRETLDMLKVLPSVKRYFGKSPWSAYFNLVGVFMLFVLGALALLAYALPRVIVTGG